MPPVLATFNTGIVVHLDIQATMLSCLKGKQKANFEDVGHTEKYGRAGGNSGQKRAVDTTERLAALRGVISDSKVDCYVIPRWESRL